MHLRQPAVARLAKSERADALGQRAFDAGPQPIEPPLFVTRRARSGRRQRLVCLTGVKRELASLGLRPGAQRLRGAGLAGGRTKVDFDAVAASFVLVFAPTHAVLALGAAHALSLPIYRKGFEAEGPLKTISKLAEDTKVKARVGQLEAEQVLPIDPGPDRLSRLSIAQALAELHQRDQGQSPGWTGRLALLGIEVGEVAILEDRPERVAQGEIGAAFGKGGASDAGGLFGHTWERLLRLERHSEASRDYRTNAALDLPSHPFANGIRPEMGQSDRNLSGESCPLRDS